MSIFFFHSFLLVLNQENNRVYTHYLHPPYYIPVCNVHRIETQQTRASHTHTLTRVASHSGDGRCKLMAGCRQVSVARTCCGELSSKIADVFVTFSRRKESSPLTFGWLRQPYSRQQLYVKVATISFPSIPYPPHPLPTGGLTGEKSPRFSCIEPACLRVGPPVC